MPTFNWVFEYQPIESEILTQPSVYKRAENNLLADEKLEPGSSLGYTSILIVYIGQQLGELCLKYQKNVIA